MIQVETLFTLLLVVQFLCQSVCSSGPSTVYISTNRKSSCLCRGQMEDVNTTPFTAEVLHSDTTVMFCTRVISVSEVVHVNTLKQLALIGCPDSGTEVTCLGKNAGFSFVNVTDLEVSNIAFVNCGAIQNGTYVNVRTNTLSPFLVSLFFFNCTNVNLVSIKVVNGNGTGVALLDTGGAVNIVHSLFENNTVRNSDLPGGGGLYIEFTHCPPGLLHCSVCAMTTKHNSYYSLLNNSLIRNDAKSMKYVGNSTFLYQDPDQISNALGRGGGLSLTFKGSACNNTINVTNSKISSNSAVDWGGGLYSIFHDSPQNNTLYIHNSEFIRNRCVNKSGGGMDIGFMLYAQTPPKGNVMVFESCAFVENEATFGGGASLYSSFTSNSQLGNRIRFINCTFESNRAIYGSALEISPQVFDRLRVGFMPNVTIEDCTFMSNVVLKRVTGSEQYIHGKGALLCTNYPLTFMKSVIFSNNSGTAVQTVSCKLIFGKGSQVMFSGNKGVEGGALNLLALSSLHINDNSTFTFLNNSAIRKGGAINEFNVDSLNFETSKTCFIHYAGTTNVSDRRIVFLFEGNKAGTDQNLEHGQTLFVTTLQPCERVCHIQERSDALFGCLGNFTFMENRQNEISTLGTMFELNHNTTVPIEVIPGRETAIPFQFLDELKNSAYNLYHISIDMGTNNSSSVLVDPAYTYISDKNITLFGNPQDFAILEVSTTGFNEIVLPIEIQMKSCPPGYVTMNTSKGINCLCSADLTGMKYAGIRHCNELEGRAYIKHGYWIGYSDNDGVSEDNIHTGYCPPKFCFGGNKDEMIEQLLPVDASKTQLDDIVCGPRRTGNLCGICRPGHSTFFHSKNFECFSDKKCTFGPLLYTTSELLPVTILFTVVILFNLQFTSGAINSLFFYFQFIDTMLIDANDIITFHPLIEILKSVYISLYGMLNLNFFTLNELSFCLWKGATALDILAIKYLTIVYSFFLICATVLLVKICSARCNKISWNHSIIHGLTAFLVMCYAQCTKVTLFILTPGRVYTMNQRSIAQVVFFNGELVFLHQKHLKYALPAIFFLITIVIFPPVLLIFYPLCYKIFTLFRIEETSCVRTICKLVPLEMLKPLFDSFQGCFKDQFRFFAGLFFLYRLATLIGFTFTNSLTRFYTALEVFLILILALHSVMQPYKKHWHNVTDVLLITNLAIINGLTMHNYKRANEQYDYGDEIKVVGAFQTALIFLPFVCIIVYIGVVITLKAKQFLNCKPTAKSEAEGNVFEDTLSVIDYREHSK